MAIAAGVQPRAPYGAQWAIPALFMMMFPSWLGGVAFAAIAIGALGFIVFLPTQYAINFQLLGGVWIIQTFPAIVVGLYTRWLDRWALLLGWAAGMLTGTGMAIALNFASQVFPLRLGDLVVPGYAAFYALILNLVVSVVA